MMAAYEAIVMGVSTGGVKALGLILSALPENFSLPVIIVQHQLPDADSYLWDYLDRQSQVRVREACPGETISATNVYLAPPGYHLQVEDDRTLSLSVDLPVNYSIPSIDVLFETAAGVYAEHLVGVVLTGASIDGSHGLEAIKARGGLAVVQDPATAEAAIMPEAAIEATEVDHILPLEKIGEFLRGLADG